MTGTKLHAFVRTNFQIHVSLTDFMILFGVALKDQRPLLECRPIHIIINVDLHADYGDHFWILCAMLASFM